MHCFKNSLYQGLKGELQFQQEFPIQLTKLSGRRADFVIKNTTITIELKTDSYPSNNFFFERWSDVERKAAGGPWQSKEKGIKLFIYYFINENRWFIFNTVDLVEYLDQIVLDKRLVSIQNSSWQSQGYIIPICELSHFNEEI